MEVPASVEIAKHTLMAGGLILAIGTVTGLLAQKIKIPDVAVFLLTGMLIGPQALGLIDMTKTMPRPSAVLSHAESNSTGSCNRWPRVAEIAPSSVAAACTMAADRRPVSAPPSAAMSTSPPRPTPIHPWPPQRVAIR